MDAAIQIIVDIPNSAPGAWQSGDIFGVFDLTRVAQFNGSWVPKGPIITPRMQFFFVAGYSATLDITITGGNAATDPIRAWHVDLAQLATNEANALAANGYLNMSWARFSAICLRKSDGAALASI